VSEPLEDRDAVTTATAESGDPYEVLRRIAQQRSELDRAEAVAVRRLRNGGASWAFIAVSLGVSRQAVHQRYGKR
jgi:hypothetical protein